MIDIDHRRRLRGVRNFSLLMAVVSIGAIVVGVNGLMLVVCGIHAVYWILYMLQSAAELSAIELDASDLDIGSRD